MRSPGIEIETAAADREPGSSLLAAMAAELDQLYADREGSLDSLPVTAEQLAAPGGSFLLLRQDGEPVACGGVKRLDDRTGEIKRMYVVPAHRGRGLGAVLLAALEEECRRIGYARVRLDTGPEQPAARAIYEGAGYERIGDYNGNPYAAFWFEKRLRGAAG